jgi:hypothetical protein
MRGGPGRRRREDHIGVGHQVGKHLAGAPGGAARGRRRRGDRGGVAELLAQDRTERVAVAVDLVGKRAVGLKSCTMPWARMASSKIGASSASLIRACGLGRTRRGLDRILHVGARLDHWRVRRSAIRGGCGGCRSTRKSRPVIAAAAKATSATPAANSPAVSSDQEKHFIPTVGSRR